MTSSDRPESPQPSKRKKLSGARPGSPATRQRIPSKGKKKKTGRTRKRRENRPKAAGKTAAVDDEKASKINETASGSVAVGPSLVPQVHGGALLGGGVPGHKGANQYSAREQAATVRAGLVTELEGAAKDLAALLSSARDSDGDRLRCKGCGAFIPGVSRLKLSDILSVIRELRALLPAQLEHEGLAPITVNLVAGVQVVPNLPAEGGPR